MVLASAAHVAHAETAPASEATLPTEWTPWNGHHYRLEADGHLSCYSENSQKSACSINAPDPAKAQPLKCNDPRWGGRDRKRTGYEVADHWCNNAYATLFATWRDYTHLGHQAYLSTNPRGDVMCRSYDGTTCPAPESLAHRIAPNSGRDLKPLVCGKLMRKQAGVTGYDQSGHWCQSNEIVQSSRDDDVWKSTEVSYSGSRCRSTMEAEFKHPPADGRYAWFFYIHAPRTAVDAGESTSSSNTNTWRVQSTLGPVGPAGEGLLTTPLVSSVDLARKDSDGLYARLRYAVRREPDDSFTYRQTVDAPLDPFDATPGETLKVAHHSKSSPDADVRVSLKFDNLTPSDYLTERLLVKKRVLPAH